MRTTVLSLSHSPRVRLALRGLGAILIVLVGVDHYYEYSVDHYSVVPTIGTLFLLNFVSAIAVGLVLLVPLERLSRRFGNAAFLFAAFSGFGIAATSLAGLLVSEQTKLFGFMEQNYRPEIVVAIASEVAAMLILVVLTWLTVSAAGPVLNPLARPRRGPGAGARTT